VYADADVYCRKPISSCISSDLWKDKSVSVVVGIEIDEPRATKRAQKHWKWSRNHGFTQWTVIAKPFSEPIKLAIVRVVSHAYAFATLRDVSDPAKLRSGRGPFDYLLGSYSVTDILEITGPGMWTDAVLDSINGYSHQEGNQRAGYKVLPTDRYSWTSFTELNAPKSAGQVLVLPINYFGSGQRHSNAGDFQVPEACVNHLAKRTWK
jgi:mannosyltransferase OCH1-like enzyme